MAFRQAVLPFDQPRAIGARAGAYGARSAPGPHGAQWPRACRRLCGPPRYPSSRWRPRPGGAQHLLDLGLPPGPICGPVYGHHGVEALEQQGPEQRHVRAIVRRDRRDATDSPRRTAQPVRHREMHARRIHALVGLDGPRLPHRVLGGPRLRAARRVPLPRVERLFLRGSPNRWRGRHLVGTLPRMPCVSATRAHRASQVSAGGARPASRLTISAAVASRRCGPPACGGGATAPVRRWRRRCFATQDTLPPNRSARARWEPSRRVEAGTIFGRKSVA